MQLIKWFSKTVYKWNSKKCQYFVEPPFNSTGRTQGLSSVSRCKQFHAFHRFSAIKLCDVSVPSNTNNHQASKDNSSRAIKVKISLLPCSQKPGLLNIEMHHSFLNVWKVRLLRCSVSLWFLFSDSRCIQQQQLFCTTCFFLCKPCLSEVPYPRTWSVFQTGTFFRLRLKEFLKVEQV